MNPVPDLDPTCGACSESSLNLSILVLLFLLGAVVGYFLARYTFLKVVRRIVSEQEERYNALSDDLNEKTYLSGSSLPEEPLPFPMRLTRLPQMMRSMVFQEPQTAPEPPEELFDIPAPPPVVERPEASGYVPEEVEDPEPEHEEEIQPVQAEPVEEIQPVKAEPKEEPKAKVVPAPAKRPRKTAVKKAAVAPVAKEDDNSIEI